MVKSAILPAAALVPLAAAALYPGVTTDNHTCVLSAPRPKLSVLEAIFPSLLWLNVYFRRACPLLLRRCCSWQGRHLLLRDLWRPGGMNTSRLGAHAWPSWLRQFWLTFNHDVASNPVLGRLHRIRGRRPDPAPEVLDHSWPVAW